MQEKESSTSDNEKGKKQTAWQIESKDNSSNAYLIEIRKNWKSWLLLTIGTLILIYLILYFIPHHYENDIMSSYNNNSTLAGMHITTGSNLLIAFVTFLYVVLTGILVKFSKKAIEQSNEAIKKSNEAIEQSKKEQRIRHIEKRLESFYMPVQDILEDPLYFFSSILILPSHPNYKLILNRYMDSTSLPDKHISSNGQILFYHVQAMELKKFMTYRYLAKGETPSLFVKFIMMETYNKNHQTYLGNFDELVKLMKEDYNRLLKTVKQDIEDYQGELNQ